MPVISLLDESPTKIWTTANSPNSSTDAQNTPPAALSEDSHEEYTVKFRPVKVEQSRVANPTSEHMGTIPIYIQYKLFAKIRSEGHADITYQALNSTTHFDPPLVIRLDDMTLPLLRSHLVSHFRTHSRIYPLDVVTVLAEAGSVLQWKYAITSPSDTPPQESELKSLIGGPNEFDGFLVEASTKPIANMVWLSICMDKNAKAIKPSCIVSIVVSVSITQIISFSWLNMPLSLVSE